MTSRTRKLLQMCKENNKNQTLTSNASMYNSALNNNCY